MDMNEFRGRVLKVNLAKPQKGPVQGAGNRASTSSLSLILSFCLLFITTVQSGSLRNGCKPMLSMQRTMEAIGQVLRTKENRDRMTMKWRSNIQQVNCGIVYNCVCMVIHVNTAVAMLDEKCKCIKVR